MAESNWLTQWLIATGLNVTTAKSFAEPMKAAMMLQGIHSVEDQAAFIANCWIESTGFTALEENLYYTTQKAATAAFGSRVVPHLQRLLKNPVAMANFVYAGRNGNGDEGSGDGWRYRGRGLIMLTGKGNYIKASIGLGVGAVFVHAPELVAKPSDACQTAALYWRESGCSDLMRKGDFDTTITRVNGRARMHAKERTAKYTKLLRTRREVEAALEAA